MDETEQNPSNDRRIVLRKDVDISLEYYMKEKATIISGIPGVEQTKTGVVNEVMMNFLAGEGHYPPKVKSA
jgi:hypothetical protein